MATSPPPPLYTTTVKISRKSERSSLAFNILGGILSFWYALEESRFSIDLATLLSDISRKKSYHMLVFFGIIFKFKCNGISGNLLNLFENYILNRFQRVVLNGNESSWTSLEAGVPQGSVLGPLLFLIYNNDLTDNISSDMRLFADDSSLFTCVKGVTQTHHKLLKDLQTVTLWAYQMKMVFNPDITKQAIEVIFSCKKDKPVHPDLTFNGVPVSREPFTKHLGVYLDSRLNFCKHIK